MKIISDKQVMMLASVLPAFYILEHAGRDEVTGHELRGALTVLKLAAELINHTISECERAETEELQ